jgi:hypothetical protein
MHGPALVSSKTIATAIAQERFESAFPLKPTVLDEE